MTSAIEKDAQKQKAERLNGKRSNVSAFIFIIHVFSEF